MKWTDLRIQPVEEGFMLVRGKVWGRIYFVRGGKQLSRLPGNMDGERWRKDPKFANTRGAAYEFGAVTKLSQAVRKSMPKVFQLHCGHRELHAKLTGKFLGAVGGLGGARGRRDLPAEVLAHSLKEMPWSKRGADSMFPNAYTRVVHEPLSLKPKVEFRFIPGQLVAPTWATHIRPFCTVIALSDLTRRKNHNRYTPKHRQFHGHWRRVDGEIMDIRHRFLTEGFCAQAQTSFRPDLLFPEAANGPYTLLVLTGLEAICYQPDGSIHDVVCFGLETAWAGNVAKSTAVERIQAEYQEKVREIYPIYKQRTAHLPDYGSPYPDFRTEEEKELERAVFREGVLEADRIFQELLKENGIKPPDKLVNGEC